MRPHLFEQPVTITLSAPHQPAAEIRYTLDASPPTAESTLYTQPIVITDTTDLRATAFRDGRQVGLPSEGAFSKLLPLPPLPDVYLGSLTPIRSVGFGHTAGGRVRYSSRGSA